MQVMGETARVMGFKGQYLNELFQPHENIKYGVKWLARWYKKTEQDVEKTLLRYNGGGNKSYPRKVLQIKENGTWKPLLKF